MMDGKLKPLVIAVRVAGRAYRTARKGEKTHSEARRIRHRTPSVADVSVRFIYHFICRVCPVFVGLFFFE